jgi:hypothetical protein
VLVAPDAPKSITLYWPVGQVAAEALALDWIFCNLIFNKESLEPIRVPTFGFAAARVMRLQAGLRSPEVSFWS